MSKKKLLQPGIHFGLSNDDYHADPALGSTSIKLLRQSVAEWWYDSAYNPRRPKKRDAEPLKVGSAYHAIVLEGDKAFHRQYVRRPDDMEGATSSEKAAITKAANASAAAMGKESLHGDDYDRALVAAEMIHQNPDLDGAFTNGMPEVSLFFDAFGIRQKVRFDYLKIRGFGDLKSIANEKRRPIGLACALAIKDYRIDMSMAHYLRGRSLLPAMVADGLVYGDHDPAWLKKVAAQPDYAAQLVFIQKTGAPLVWSKVLSPANPLIQTALSHVDEGLLKYQEAVAKFGLDKMWIDEAVVNELSPEDMPATFFFDQQSKPQ